VLKNAKPKLRKAILSNCNKELINTISECVLNLLNGNLKLTVKDVDYKSSEVSFAQSLEGPCACHEEEAYKSTRRIPRASFIGNTADRGKSDI
jgi:hypothetical protein